MTEIQKVKVLLDETKIVLKVIRDLKSGSKSTKKNKLTMIEKHTALLVDLYKDLWESYKKEKFNDKD